MTETHIVTYLLILPILCLIVGYIIGRKTGWQLRDNKAKKEKLLDDLNLIKEKVDDISSKTDVWTPAGFHSFDFNIIGISKNKEEEPLTLEEQLEKALEEEDYERAAQIRNQLNNENEKEK